jgi:ribonuclease HI
MIFCFAEPLGIVSSYHAELNAAMTSIEIAYQTNWHNIWIETDSTLVVLAFKNSNIVIPWCVRNIWHNVKLLYYQMNGLVSRIHREGNQVADSLANHGCTLNSISFWQEAPVFLLESLGENKLGLPCFRFCS